MNILKLISGPIFPLMGILLVIQVRSDGYFPLPRDLPENWIIAIVMLHTIFLAVCISRSIYLLISEKDFPVLENQNIIRFSMIVIPVLALLVICGIHILQASKFRELGYEMDLYVLFSIFIVSLCPLFYYWAKVRKKNHSIYLFLICILASSLIIKMVPLGFFPLNPERSDMLPIIKDAATKILDGHGNIYDYENINGFQYINIRPPGLIIAYAPAVILNLDLRVISILLDAVTLFLLIGIIRKAESKSASAKIPFEIILPLTCLVLLPYWHFRHELYEPPLWFVLFATILSLESRFYLGFVVGLSALFVTHQWGWVMGPFLMIGFIKQQGWRSAFPGLIVVFFLSAITFASVLTSFDQFISVFLNIPYFDYLYLLSMNMHAIFYKLNFQEISQPIGGVLQIPFIILAFKHGHRVDALCGILAGSILVTLLFRMGPSWTYQYLLVSFLLISGFVFRYKSSAYSA